MRQTLLALALIAAPAAVLADDFSYTYADARYFSTDSDAFSANLQGVQLAASVAVTPMFFVASDFSYGKSDRFSNGTTSGKYDSIVGAVRAGAHQAITPVLDAVVSVGGLYVDISGKDGFSGQDGNDFGYIAEAGARLMVVPRFEIGAFYDYQNVSSTDSGAFKGDLQFHVNENISVVGAAIYGRSADVYTVGARYRF